MNESLSKFDRQGAIRGLEQVLRKKFRNFVMRQEMRAIASISWRAKRAAHDEILKFFSQNLRESPNGDAGGRTYSMTQRRLDFGSAHLNFIRSRVL